jgi:hypothetical protein
MASLRRAEAAAVRAMASGSHHRTMSAINLGEVFAALKLERADLGAEAVKSRTGADSRRVRSWDSTVKQEA